jgi:hypothetical protein
MFGILTALTACFNGFDPAPEGDPPAENTGLVQLALGSAAARTLLPSTFTFDTWEIKFEPASPVNDREAQSFTAPQGQYTLIAGNWDISVKGYRGTGEDKTLAAQTASPVSITVASGSNTQVTVNLTFAAMTGTGSLQYAITNTSGLAPDEAVITLTALGTGTGKAIDVTAVSGGTDSAVEAGYYLAVVRLEKDTFAPTGGGFKGVSRAVWSDVVHIYPGQTTSLAHTFTAGDFFSGVEELWVFGGITGWNIDASWDSYRMTANADGTFGWEGEAEANAEFRFALADTHAWTAGTYDKWQMTSWFVPETAATAVTIGGDGNALSFVPVHHNDNSHDRNWKFETAAYYTLTVDPAARKLHVAKPVIVASVTVSGAGSVTQGNTATFTATVSGNNVEAAQGVTWSLTGASNPTGTTIDSTSGVLTVAADETGTLTITATSTVNTAKYGTKSVSVSSASATPLTKVSSVSFSAAGVASWTGEADDSDVTEYAVQLYKDSVNQGDAVAVTQGASYSVDFLSAMRTAGTGSYTITVTATGDGANFSDADESEHSSAQTVSRRTAVQYTWWHEYDKARWVNPDAAGDYSVQLYKDGTALGAVTTVDRSSDVNPDNAQETITTYDFAGVKAANGIGQYSFRVVAKGDDALVLDAAETTTSGETGYSPLGASRVWTIVAGGGVYVAGGDGGKIAYSSNGTSWTLATQSVFGDAEAVRGIAYNGSDTFVAVGYNGKIATSLDGAAWTERTSSFGATNILCVAYGSGTFLAGGDGGEVRASADGATWATITGWADSTICDRNAILTLIYDGTQFVAGGANGQIAKSTAGTGSWTWVLNDIGGTIRNYKNFAFGSGTIVLALASDTWLPRIIDCSNPDWSAPSAPANPNWGWSEHFVTNTIEGVGFGGSTFIAFGGGGLVSSSGDNGANWTAIDPGTAADQTQFATGDTITAACFMSGGQWILGGPGRFAVITP